MRKKQVLLSCLLMLIGVSMSAQTSLKAQSLYDVNQDDKVNVSDVTTVVKKVAENASTDKTVVDTEALLTVLNKLSSDIALIKAKLGIEDEPDDTPEDSHAYVEIGGLKWATMNLGATTVAGSPSTCYGDYYAWGETEPRYTSITITGASSATFGGWSSSHGSGYSSSDYPSYTGTTLDATHDAATQAWGSNWRTPTSADFQALIKACTGSTSDPDISPILTSTPTGGIYSLSSDQEYLSEYKGVEGVLFVDKTDASKQVFFPAAGACYNTSFGDGGSSGNYWSSSLYTSNTYNAYPLVFNYMGGSMSQFTGRYFGLTVRPVSD